MGEAAEQIEFVVAAPGMYQGFAFPNLAISPDGRWLAFQASSGSRTVIVVRSIASTELVELDGTEDAETLFWSPDSRYIGFFAARRLKKVAVDGGPPQDIAVVVGNKYGATWNSDGVIVFSAENIFTRSPTQAAIPRPWTSTVLQLGVSVVISLPRRRASFLELSGPGEGQGIYVASLDGGPAARILAVASRTLLASGHLFYQREGTLFAHRFDERALALTSEPIRVAQRISYSAGTGNASFSVSTNGAIGVPRWRRCIELSVHLV